MTESPPPLLLWLPGEENTIREEDEVDARSTRQPADASFFLFGGKAVGSYLVMGNDRLVLCSRFNEGDVSKVVVVLLLLTKGSDLVDEDVVLDDEWLPSGLTRAKWSCGDPLMWM